MKLSRMKFWNLCIPGLWWLLGLGGPVTSEILELQIVRLIVFAGPATDEILRSEVLTGPVADEILEPLFSWFVVIAGRGWACHKENL